MIVAKQIFITYTIGLVLLCNLIGLAMTFLPFLSKNIYNLRIQKRAISVQAIMKRLPLIGLNIFLLCVISIIGIYFMFPLFDSESAISPSQILIQLLIILIFDDLFFYLFHRWMHQNKYVLKKIHSIHHQASAPFALDYIYAHPIEWLIGYIGPFIALLLIGIFNGINYWAFFLYILIRNIHELDIHSGFPSVLSKYIPLWGDSEHHDLHHEKSNGNYASTFTIWDRIFKTKM